MMAARIDSAALDSKELATLRAQFALAGHELLNSKRTDGTPCLLAMLGSIARSTRNEPPNNEQRIAWRKESIKRAHAEFGEQAESMLNDARRFVAADPKRAAMVARNGVGDHPDMVLAVVEMARRAKRDGRFK